MNIRGIIRKVAYIELFIGVVTLSGLAASLFLSLPVKPLNVFLFVLISAVISTAIGVGILTHRRWARTLLVFFSGYIIITKVLIFANLLHFSGEIITFVSSDIKNTISLCYHGFVLIFFTRLDVKTYFIGMSE